MGSWENHGWSPDLSTLDYTTPPTSVVSIVSMKEDVLLMFGYSVVEYSTAIVIVIY